MPVIISATMDEPLHQYTALIPCIDPPSPTVLEQCQACIGTGQRMQLQAGTGTVDPPHK